MAPLFYSHVSNFCCPPETAAATDRGVFIVLVEGVFLLSVDMRVGGLGPEAR